MKQGFVSREEGPFHADQLRPGDRYELSNGHPVYCMPTGPRGAKATLVGGAVLQSDPAVEAVGTDAGFSPSPDILRAPDLAVGALPDQPGWVQGVPPLAVEYSDTGQDEQQLGLKIRELLASGTQILWVVRLTGPRRVEVHAPGRPMRLAHPGDELTAPGILKNPVPVEALYDPEVGRDVVFRNLLERQGYESLDAVREEGEVNALREAVLALLAVRGLSVPEDVGAIVTACTDLSTLKRWLERAVTAESAAAVLVST